MSDTTAYSELELLDALISSLEALIAESDDTPLMISYSEQGKRAFYRLTGSAAATISDRRPKAADAVFLDAERLVLRCNKTEVVRLTRLEVAVQAEKSSRGETLAMIAGKVSSIKKVRGGYDIEIEIAEMRNTCVTPGQKLRECVGKADVQGWNRWCQDIRGAMDLTGIDLQKADLSGFDLCCADLGGANLTGANLAGTILAGSDLADCNLEQAAVVGADFFRAKMRRGQASLLGLAGMPEIESVVFVD